MQLITDYSPCTDVIDDNNNKRCRQNNNNKNDQQQWHQKRKHQQLQQAELEIHQRQHKIHQQRQQKSSAFFWQANKNIFHRAAVKKNKNWKVKKYPCIKLNK